MKVVVEAVWSIRIKFYQLGSQLDVEPGTLDAAKGGSFGDPGEALSGIIKAWLRRSTPIPTWKALVRALRTQSVDEGDLADQIAAKYCPNEVETSNETGSYTIILNIDSYVL